MSDKKFVGTFQSELEVLDKIDELKLQGFSEHDIYVVTNNKDSLSMVHGRTDVDLRSAEGNWMDKFKAFITGDEPVKSALKDMNFTEEESERYYNEVKNGGILLYVDNDNTNLEQHRTGMVDEHTGANFGSNVTDTDMHSPSHFGSNVTPTDMDSTNKFGSDLTDTHTDSATSLDNNMGLNLEEEERLRIDEERVNIDRERSQAGEVFDDRGISEFDEIDREESEQREQLGNDELTHRTKRF